MTMDFIQVDQGKCTRCGLCVKVCRGVLEMGGGGPEIIRPLCIACGQCVAVCPQAALDNAKFPLAKQTSIKETLVLDADAVAQFLRYRRSIRDYQQKPVPREKVLQVLDIARMAPTACNSQGIAYHVVDNPNTLRAIAAIVTEWAEGELNRDSAMAASPWAPNSTALIEIFRQTGEDIVLRSAPCLIVAIADNNYAAPVRDNAYLSLAYAQLFAVAIGLGTCWAGLFEYCAASGHKPLLALLNLPKNMQVVSGMMVGYPKYTYQRLVDRNPLQVTWQ
jgi:nitroreductase/NAD-dependent dihydropyrimidine dehydrogenase PreA subunit